MKHVADGTPLYRKVYWRCTACGATGLVLIHNQDAPAQQRRRLEMSHRAQQTRTKCPEPRFTERTDALS